MQPLCCPEDTEHRNSCSVCDELFTCTYYTNHLKSQIHKNNLTK